MECAIEEDAQGIAITSYQGGHVEFFKYMKDLLDENGCGHIKIFGGGGGTILPQEIEELHIMVSPEFTRLTMAAKWGWKE